MYEVGDLVMVAYCLIDRYKNNYKMAMILEVDKTAYPIRYYILYIHSYRKRFVNEREWSMKSISEWDALDDSFLWPVEKKEKT